MQPPNDRPVPRRDNPPRWVRRHGADPLWGWAVGGTLALLVTLLLPRSIPLALRLVTAWDVAALALVGLPWWIILRSTAERTRARAAQEDPGRVALLGIAVLACVVALGAAIVLLRAPEQLGGTLPVGVIVALGVAAVLSAWTLLHTAFALHYAHLYYQTGQPAGGLNFPHTADPDDFDFAYFAVTLGIAAQTADVSITDRRIRRLVLGHAVLSFAFNTVILALTINLIFDLLK